MLKTIYSGHLMFNEYTSEKVNDSLQSFCYLQQLMENKQSKYIKHYCCILSTHFQQAKYIYSTTITLLSLSLVLLYRATFSGWLSPLFTTTHRRVVGRLCTETANNETSSFYLSTHLHHIGHSLQVAHAYERLLSPSK